MKEKIDKFFKILFITVVVVLLFGILLIYNLSAEFENNFRLEKVSYDEVEARFIGIGYILHTALVISIVSLVLCLILLIFNKSSAMFFSFCFVGLFILAVILTVNIKNPVSDDYDGLYTTEYEIKRVIELPKCTNVILILNSKSDKRYIINYKEYPQFTKFKIEVPPEGKKTIVPIDQ